MSSSVKGEVSFRVVAADGSGEETFTLQYSIDALCRLEERLDLGLDEIAVRLSNKLPRLSFLRTLLWAGLQAHHQISEKQVGEDVLAVLGIPKASQLIVEAFLAAFPQAGEAAEGVAGPQPAAADGSGQGS